MLLVLHLNWKTIFINPERKLQRFINYNLYLWQSFSPLYKTLHPRKKCLGLIIRNKNALMRMPLFPEKSNFWEEKWYSRLCWMQKLNKTIWFTTYNDGITFICILFSQRGLSNKIFFKNKAKISSYYTRFNRKFTKCYRLSLTVPCCWFYLDSTSSIYNSKKNHTEIYTANIDDILKICQSWVNSKLSLKVT